MTAQVVEASVTVNNNSPIQDYVHPDDQTQPTFEITPGFKPFTDKKNLITSKWTNKDHRFTKITATDIIIRQKATFVHN